MKFTLIDRPLDGLNSSKRFFDLHLVSFHILIFYHTYFHMLYTFYSYPADSTVIDEITNCHV